MKQHDHTRQNPESVQEVSKVLDPGRSANVRPTSKRNRDKTHVDYWKARLFRNTYAQNGRLTECGKLAVKIQHRGQRETFGLQSSNRDTAAREAKEIYACIVANGMAAAMAKFKPEAAQRVESPTVGQFLAEVRAKAGLRPKTFKCYRNALRKIVADVFKIDGGNAKFDYRTGGYAEWQSRVDSIKLASLTPEKVQAWKVATLDRARANPVQFARTKRTVNSFMRQAKSLFSQKATRFLVNINLPNPLPFAGVAFEKAGSLRYQSRIDHRTLVVAAQNELAETHPEQFKIFLLALGAGLRKAEIDTLTWKQIDWQNATIWIGATEHFTPKSEDSQGTVDVDIAVLDELRRYMPHSRGEFVINSPAAPRPNAPHQFYRAENEFYELNAWLRSKGIDPTHDVHRSFPSKQGRFFDRPRGSLAVVGCGNSISPFPSSPSTKTHWPSCNSGVRAIG